MCEEEVSKGVRRNGIVDCRHLTFDDLPSVEHLH